MMGKILAAAIVLTALIAGAAMYYLQVYYYYEKVRLVSEGGEVEMKITLGDGGMIDLPARGFRGIDAESSPIRFRACFETGLPQDVGLTPYADAVPLMAPGWFDCFDAKAIGEDLEAGGARAYLGQKDVVYGVDRVLAIYPDGRGYAWHQINRCGKIVFDGQPAPADCPSPPQGY